MSPSPITRLQITTKKHCRMCGRTFMDSEFPSREEQVCVACLMSRGDAVDDEGRRQRVLDALEARMRQGRSHGNGKDVAYPAGLDYRLTRLLESMRPYCLKVRITIASDRYDDADRVIEGYFRRYAPLDGHPDDFGLNQDLLGLFSQVDGTEPTACIYEEDYSRIMTIECIDFLLRGIADPITVWMASAKQLETFATIQGDSLAREKRRAKSLLLHVGGIVAIWTTMVIAIFKAWVAGENGAALGWFVTFMVVGFASGMTMACWERLPDLSVLVAEKQRRH